MVIDEDALRAGIAMYAGLAIEYLRRVRPLRTSLSSRRPDVVVEPVPPVSNTTTMYVLPLRLTMVAVPWNDPENFTVPTNPEPAPAEDELSTVYALDDL